MIHRLFSTAHILRYWVPLAVLATIMCGLVYASVRYSMRTAANDPQVEIVEDIVKGAEGGQAPQNLVPPFPVDMEASLSTYAIIFDAERKPIVGSAQLDGEIPVPPPGVFAYAKEHGQNRITWQPKTGVRSAIVVAPYGGDQPGFVLVGRSLREVEMRAQRVLLLSFIAWIISLVATFVVASVITYWETRRVGAA